MNTHTFTAVAVLASMLLASSAASYAQGLSFLEEYALADDRAAVLEQLVPGSPEHFYFHCLYHQSEGRLDRAEELIRQWVQRHGQGDERLREVQNRQALLRYADDPAAALERIRLELGLRFDHERERLEHERRLPNALDQNLISRETLARRALQAHTNLHGFEDSALEWLARESLDPNRLRDLLGRMSRPDVPGLVALIARDLDHPNSGGFGSLQIHRLLLKEQLDELARLKPDLVNQTHFVNAYLARLRPGADEDVLGSPDVRQRHLERMWAFVRGLDPAHNSLKAHVLYRILDFDRQRGVYDKARFMEYLALPRAVPYIPRELQRRPEYARFRADLNADFQNLTLLPPVRDEEPLVREYLAHFFVTDSDYAPYARFVNDQFLKRLFAETKILHGVGDMAQWQAMLTPGQLQALRDRVDLDFAPDNRRLYGPDDPVALDLFVKNVSQLFVRVYEMDAENFYRREGREIGTDVDLDGLVANKEDVHEYRISPLRRVRRRFEFPALDRRGVFVVEFIGGGRSSRAVVRKGSLSFVERVGVAGHVLTVLDGHHRPVPGASAWLQGQHYQADEAGELLVPFTAEPGRRPIVLISGDFAALDHLDHLAENYSLAAGFHVEREALLRGAEARVVVRPTLLLNGRPTPLGVLEEPRLTVESWTRQGLHTSRDVPGFALSPSEESAHSFRVPEDLARIRFTLRAKVKALSRGKDEDLSASAEFAVNRIDATDRIADLHFSRAEGGYVVDVLGKTGEPADRRSVRLELKHQDFRQPVHATLQTDEAGRVRLGALEGIVSVRATLEDGGQKTWAPPRDQFAYPPTVHAKAGEAIEVPWVGPSPAASRDNASLLEVIDGTFVRDWFECLRVDGATLRIEGLLPGDYDLLLKEAGARVSLRVAKGDLTAGHVMSERRRVEASDVRPMHIASVRAEDGQVRVRLANADQHARVHVFATRYLPAFPAFAGLRAPGLPLSGPWPVVPPESDYVSGRRIGDEQRYILERQYAPRFPGNMLERPGLLLNPWAWRDTETGRETARVGEEWERAMRPPAPAAPRPSVAPSEAPPGMADFASLDFLASPAPVLLNLRPNEDGEVVLPADALAGRQHLHVVAADLTGTAYRQVALADSPLEARSLRMADAFDPAKRFIEQRQITAVEEGGTFALADIAASRFEIYDSIEKVFALYATLSGDAKLETFRFVAKWDKLSDAEKRRLYSEHASHELNFFLSRKDPAFFEEVATPFLANKKEMQFMDRYLLGEDVSGYLAPWEHGRLNVAERILLGRRIEAERAAMQRHVREAFQLVPPDLEGFRRIFDTALRGRELDTADDFDVAKAREEQRIRRAEAEPRRMMALRERPGVVADAAVAPEAERLADRRKRLQADAAADMERREAVRQLYQTLDQTKEWVENHYYRLPLEEQTPELVKANAFWDDFAQADPDAPFRSPHFALATGSFPEMMFALAVLDLPFESPRHDHRYEAARLEIAARSPMLVFHEEVKEAAEKEDFPVLVSQNNFRHGDRYRQVDGERVDKFVTDEFLPGVVYGSQVVVTNPTSATRRLDILLQIPQGAVPANNGFYTRSFHASLAPYRTWTFDYYFYFPDTGDYPHYPAQVSRQGRLVASAEPGRFNVVAELQQVDRESWDYVSQFGTDDDVMAFLHENNVQRIALNRIAFRMRDRDMFRAATDLLRSRRAFDPTLWSYSVRHNDPRTLREFLASREDFLRRCGPWLSSPLVEIDPIVRHWYQHMEYKPLVNARAHRLGERPTILNDRFREQYDRLMAILARKPAFDRDDLMAATYYLLLQDRVDEALKFFGRLDPEDGAMQLQYDYLSAYMAFFTGDHARARALAGQYADLPVDRWRNLFAQVAAHLDEAEGAATVLTDEQDREQRMARLAATEPALDFEVEGQRIILRYRNVDRVQVRLHLVDIEMLFSRRPFMRGAAEPLSAIRPHETLEVDLDPAATEAEIPLPEAFRNRNVLVEVSGAGVRKASAHYSNALNVQVVENYGQVRVTARPGDAPLPRVYVKAYARMRDGSVTFYKDGYTDIRGRFDYSSLSTDELDRVDAFALLILSEEHGAVVREARAPRR